MMANFHAHTLQASQAVLLVVDIQERLLPNIHYYQQVVKNTQILIQTCQLLDVPVIVSEQYVKGLGPTIANISQWFNPQIVVLEKTTFGALAEPTISEAFQRLNRSQVVVCGVETHVCVNQSVHQLLAENYQPHVVADAVSSRTPENKAAGLNKMQQAGAVITTTETALFELLHDAKNPAFKQVQALIK